MGEKVGPNGGEADFGIGEGRVLNLADGGGIELVGAESGLNLIDGGEVGGDVLVVVEALGGSGFCGRGDGGGFGAGEGRRLELGGGEGGGAFGLAG